MIIALIVAWLIFTILIKVVKTTVKTALMIATVVVLLQVGYGIGPQDILNYMMQLPQNILQIRK
ncbi:MAG: hypothetical protein HXY43_08115 [Fischerella sp.]|jgi:hypothetical protein|uniref:hypothetical protein n=1 Tax=unclassified Fischerella TaxID=494603 RepID=UPI00047D932A|nr:MULTISPECIES: hypothetical protein [unclassified Fischerella]NWF59258.1 hypothetical protein [Fischerella sp.]